MSNQESPYGSSTLVIGGGIAGIQASLEIANSGNKVYLVEQSATIGGHMAMFDKTFPTLDCAACILSPKMVEVGQHPLIDLMIYSEVRQVTRVNGHFTAKILKKAKRVDPYTCIGCGECAKKCPGRAPSEFDSGITTRKAIYIPFPQAVPNKYVIDADSCRYVESGKCGVCVKFCNVNCIDLDEQDKEIGIEASNIIVATGFQPFDATRIERYGYGKFPNVLTSIEFERLVNAAGPTGGNIKFRQKHKKGYWHFKDEGEEPRSLALIHCIGSRDENHHKYCSAVCCMYSLKLAHLVREKLPDAEIFEYYIDMRAYGKDYEEFYERVKSEGIHMIRGKTARIDEKDGGLVLRSEDMVGGRLIEQVVDMVVLAVGLEPRCDASDMSGILGIASDEYGWFMEQGDPGDTISTGQDGIFIAGACQGPKDIPDSVAQGSAAAASVLQNIMSLEAAREKEGTARIELEPEVINAK